MLGVDLMIKGCFRSGVIGGWEIVSAAVVVVHVVVEMVVLLRMLMLATLLLVVGVRIDGGNCGLGLGRFSFLDCFDSDCNCCWFCG